MPSTLLCIICFYAFCSLMHSTLLCILCFYAFYASMRSMLLCILFVFFRNLSQPTTLALLFCHTHVTHGRMKRMVWTYGFIVTFYPLICSRNNRRYPLDLRPYYCPLICSDQYILTINHNWIV